ncbi:Kunitz/Bovine pancreatic trypsin inhibitor domain protein, partial [Ancylostoma duodenale]
SDHVCNLRYDSGKFAVGGEKSDRYFYTSQYKTCMRFSYYGTLGNENNFPDYNSCMRMCGAQQ